MGRAVLVACALAAVAQAGAMPAHAAPAAGAAGAARIAPNAPNATPPVARWLAESGLDAHALGMIAIPLGGGEAIVRHNANAAMNPASTMKLLTSLAALSVLGPEYRWRTDAHLRGRLADGVLEGDLVLRGGGDPKLVIEDLAEFIARMRAAGLREIRGDLVLDDAIYDVGEASVQDFDGDPSQPYNVRPFGVLMNFKAVKIVVGASNGAASVALDPPLAGVKVDNRMAVSRGACRFAIAVSSSVTGMEAIAEKDTAGPRPPHARATPAASPREASQAASPREARPTAAAQKSRVSGPDAATITVSGQIAPACGERSVFSAVLDHRRFVDALFRAAWQAAGGQWSGAARVERGAARGEPWLAWHSPRTLADVVHDVNKFSNNVMARHLLLQLAVAAGSAPATEEAARRALRDWLARQGMAFPELVVENGSGLSRTARISAASLARVLEFAAAGPHAHLVRGSLPIAGVDGTMKYRLAGQPIAGNAWIKTGSLAEVRTIAGYVDAASGRRYAVVLLANGPGAESAARVQEQFLRWVHANG